MITKKDSLVWISYPEGNCQTTAVASLDGKLNVAFAITQPGASANSSTPFQAGLGVSFADLACGHGYLKKSVESGLPYEVTNAKLGDLDADNGRIACPYPESFEMNNQSGDNSSANGDYKLTTTFFSNKPTYKNANGWWITWNGTDWSLTDGFPPNFTKEIKNGDSEPNGGTWSGGNPGPSPTPTPVAPVYDGNSFCIEELTERTVFENQPRAFTDNWQDAMGFVTLSSSKNTIVMSARNDSPSWGNQDPVYGAGVSNQSLRVLDWDGNSWNQRGKLIHAEGWLADQGRIGHLGTYRARISDDGNRIAVLQMYSGSSSGIQSVRVWEWRQFQESDVGNYYHYNLFQDVDSNQKKKTIITYDKSAENPVTPVVGEYYWTQLGNDISSVAYSSTSKIDFLSVNSNLTQVYLSCKDGPANLNIYRVFEWNGEDDDWKQKGFDIKGFEATSFLQNNYFASSLSGDRIAIESAFNTKYYDGKHNNPPLWIMVFEWKEFTDADLFKYIHGTRSHAQNKPIVITSNDKSTDPDPVVGDYYWTQVGLTIEEIFDVSRNASPGVDVDGIHRRVDWSLGNSSALNFDIDDKFETIVIPNSQKTACFHKLQRVGQDMRWVKQEYSIEFQRELWRDHILLSKNGDRLMLIGEIGDPQHYNEYLVESYWFNSETQEWIFRETTTIDLDRGDWQPIGSVAKVHNDFVWANHPSVFNLDDYNTHGFRERLSFHIYETNQECLGDGPPGPMPTPTPTCQTEVILPAVSSNSTYYDVTRTYEKGDPSVPLGNGTSRGGDLIKSSQTSQAHYVIQYNFCKPTTIYGYEIFGLFMTGSPWWGYQSATFKLRITNEDDTWEDIDSFLISDQHLDVSEETTFTATRVAIYAASFGERGYSWLDYFKLHTEPIGSQGPIGSYSIFGDAFVNGYDITTMFFRIEKSSNIGVGDSVIVNDVNFTYETCGTEQPTIDLNGTTGEVTKVTEDGDYIDIEFLHNQDVTSSCAGTYSSGGTITLQS